MIGRSSAIERMIASKAPTTSSISAVDTGKGLPVSIVSAKDFEQHPERVGRRVDLGCRLLADLCDGQHCFLARFRRAFAAKHHDPPIHRGGADGREHARRAAFELYERRGCIARIRRRLLRIDGRVHFSDRPRQVDECVEHMQPGAGHAAARGFARIVAPSSLHPCRMFIGEVAFDMQDVTDDSHGNDAFEFAHAWEAALVVAQREGNVGLLAGGNGALGFGTGERERLLAPHRLAGRRHGGNLSDVQRVRGCEKNRLNTGIGNGLLELRGQFEALGRREIADQFRLFAHAADKPQALAFALNRIDDIFSPAAEADYGGIDHEWWAGWWVNVSQRILDRPACSRQIRRGIREGKRSWTIKSFTNAG